MSGEGDGFFCSYTTFASNDKVLTSKAIKDNKKGKQATKGSSSKGKKEERKGEMELIRKGEQDKKEEIERRLFGRTIASFPPSQPSKTTTKTSSSRKSRRSDISYVEGDYDTETGEFLSDLEDDDDLSDSEFDSDSDFDSDLAPTHTSTSASSSRPSSATTTSNTSTVTTSDADDDSIPTLCSDGIQREQAGLPTVEEEEESKRTRKPAFAEYIDYGNGESEFLWSLEGRKKPKTAEEKRNRSKLEKQNDEVNEWFWDLVDKRRKASVKKAMRDYKPVHRKAIE